MISRSQMIAYATCTIAGAALSATAYHFIAKSRAKPEPVSTALCFLQDKIPAKAFAQIDGTLVSKENLPPDLYNSYLQVEADTQLRYQELAKQLAVRMDAQGSANGKVDPKLAPALDRVVGEKVSDETVKKYFDQNRNAFPNVPFDKVKDLIKNMLQRQESDFIIKSKLSGMEKENRFHILYPMPCGGKVDVPYSNTLPGRGNTTGKVSLLYTFNYNCPQCRQMGFELNEFLNQNLASMRLWFLPVPGKPGTRAYNFAAGLQCAFQLDSANVIAFHKTVMDAPFYSENQNDGRKEIVEIAQKSGLDAKKFAQCLDTPETAKTLAEYQKFADTYKIDGSAPRYFLNGRGMDPNLGINLLKTLKTVLSEANRLQKLL